MKKTQLQRKTTIIFSISSDIGYALAIRRIEAGWIVIGTYRQYSNRLNCLKENGAILLEADFKSRNSLQSACKLIMSTLDSWDEMVMAPGLLEPIAPFEFTDFNEWAISLDVNFVNQAFALRLLLEKREVNALVLFFSGSGTNGTADLFSAYTVSKIAIIKFAELLDSEISDTKFVVIGPGWVKSKIHNQTINSDYTDTKAVLETRRRLEKDQFTPMDSVLNCIDWVGSQKKEIISGRNISVTFDIWRDEAILEILLKNSDTGKLRRNGNSELNGRSP